MPSGVGAVAAEGRIDPETTGDASMPLRPYGRSDTVRKHLKNDAVLKQRPLRGLHRGGIVAWRAASEERT